MTELPFEDPKPRTGTRLSDTWILSDSDIEFAQSCGMTTAQITLEADKFRDYWTALPGQKARKLDWPATWRNWIRKDYAKHTAAVKTLRRAQRPTNIEQLKIIAAHVKQPWCERGAYGRDVLEQCVAAGVLTRERMEEVL